MTFPADPGLDRWLELYYAVARRNGGEPDAGRRLLSWAHAAGLRDVDGVDQSSWCYASPAEREWWGNSWAGRATASAFAEQARRLRAGDAAASSTRSRRRGCAGATPTTAGSACCTANCSSASERPRARIADLARIRAPSDGVADSGQPWRAALAWTAVLTYCASPGAICS